MKDRSGNTTIGILTSAQLAPRDCGRTFLQGLLEAVPGWRPHTYSDCEPVDRPFDTSNVNEALKSWEWSFFWKRKCPGVRGAVFANSGIHGSIYLSMLQEDFSVPAMLRLVRRLADDFTVDLAYVHRSDSGDLDPLDDYRIQTMYWHSPVIGGGG